MDKEHRARYAQVEVPCMGCGELVVRCRASMPARCFTCKKKKQTQYMREVYAPIAKERSRYYPELLKTNGTPPRTENRSR